MFGPWALPIAIIAVLVDYFTFGPRKTACCGPGPEAFVRRWIDRLLRIEHTLAGGFAVWVGFFLAAPRLMILDVVTAIVLGPPIGYVWARYRLRRVEIRWAGPDDSVPEERLFPSDRLARLLHEGFAPPLPMWLDLLVLTACLVAGWSAGLALSACGAGAR